MKVIQIERFNIRIGQTQAENDVLIRTSNKDDWWFHLDSGSSPHIVVGSNGEILSKSVIRQVSELFPLYKSGLGKRYNVIYTQIRNVSLTSIPGTVIPIRTNLIRCKKYL